MAYKSFLDKHGAKAVALAKKMSERQKHEQIIDNQTRGKNGNTNSEKLESVIFYRYLSFKGKISS